jgi:hypothetical protein
MENSRQLEDLIQLAESLGVEISISSLADSEFTLQSGFCKLHGKDLVIFDKQLPVEERIEILLQAVGNFDLDSIYISPWIREELDQRNNSEMLS